MSDTAAKRRWFQFTLRRFFLVVALVAAWLGWNAHRVHQRRQFQHDIAWRSARIMTPAFHARFYSGAGSAAKMPLVWKLFGAEPLGSIQLPDNEFDDDDRRRIQSLFPEAVVSLERYPLGRGTGMM